MNAFKELIIKTLLRIIQRNKLIFPDSVIVVGVSGGADSLMLLHALYTLQSRLGFRLHAASLDHSLRPDSAADVAFVAQMAARMQVPFTAGRVDVLQLAAETRTGIETAARQARYRFLAEVARAQGAQRVAVGHHAGDQVETVLMHLLRGTGTHGLQGMRPLAPLPGAPDLLLIRPLLTLSRSQIDAYCQQNGLQPRVDPTNADQHILRNYIRHELLSQLKTVNPQIDDALLRLSEIAAVEQRFLEQAFMREVAPYEVIKDSSRVKLQRDVYRLLHPALQRRWIYTAAARLGAEAGLRDIDRALELAQRGIVSKIAQFPGRVQMRIDYDWLVIEQADSPADSTQLPLLPPNTVLEVPVPGLLIIPGANWQLLTGPIAPGASAVLDLPMGSHLILRTRRPGDRLVLRSGESQKLSDWMINRKVPRAVRDRLPLLDIDGHVAAIGWGQSWTINARFTSTSKSEQIVAIFMIPCAV